MNPLRCKEVQNSIVDYLEFELPLEKREQFYEHLVQCDECRSLHDDFQAALVDTKNLDLHYPDEAFWDALPGKVLEQVKQAEAKQAGTHLATGEQYNKADNVIDFSSTLASALRAKSERPRFNKSQSKQTQSNLEIIPGTATHADNKQRNMPRPSTQELQRSVRTYWPKFVLPVAAAVVIGVAAAFSLLNSESVSDEPVGFQAQIISDQSLAKLAQQITPLSQPASQFGFTAQPSSLNAFSLGSMFSQAVVFSGADSDADNTNSSTIIKTQLALLTKALLRENNPDHETIAAIEDLQVQLQHDAGTSALQNKLVMLGTRHAAHLQAVDSQAHTLFNAGVWLFDFALAALAHDEQQVRQHGALVELKNRLKAMGVPVGVDRSLDRILGVVQKPVLQDRDYKVILKQVENIRGLLG